MVRFTSHVRCFSDSKLEKYEQGTNTVLIPVMEGESYDIQGAEKVRFMGLRRFTVKHEQIVLPVVNVELQ